MYITSNLHVSQNLEEHLVALPMQRRVQEGPKCTVARMFIVNARATHILTLVPGHFEFHAASLTFRSQLLAEHIHT
jgi:hypothetical protein